MFFHYQYEARDAALSLYDPNTPESVRRPFVIEKVGFRWTYRFVDFPAARRRAA